jgi:hypothetical protein
VIAGVMFGKLSLSERDRLDQAHWQSAWAVLERRAAKRDERQQQMQVDQQIGELKAGSPPILETKNRGVIQSFQGYVVQELTKE